MKAKIVKLVLLAVGLVWLTSCVTTTKTKMVPDSMVMDLTPAYESGNFISKVDGVVVLLDASSSMGETYNDYVKFDIAKAFVRRMNDTMPPIDADAGLRTFGHARSVSRDNTKLFSGMSMYDRDQMNEGLSEVTTFGGPSPMGDAIKAVGSDLEGIVGHKALIIVSDGKDLKDKPFMAARELEARMGDDLRIYTVTVGDDARGKASMAKLASISSGGFMTMAQNMNRAEPMVEYVSEVFLDRVVRVEVIGLGYHPPEPFLESLGDVHFNFDNSSLTKAGETVLEDHIQVLSKNPDVKIIIEGHASAAGPEEYNQTLSEKRALTVQNYFVNSGSVSADRLSTVGFGENDPLFVEQNPESVNSMEAKANRRVVFDVVEEVEIIEVIE